MGHTAGAPQPLLVIKGSTWECPQTALEPALPVLGDVCPFRQLSLSAPFIVSHCASTCHNHGAKCLHPMSSILTLFGSTSVHAVWLLLFIKGSTWERPQTALEPALPVLGLFALFRQQSLSHLSFGPIVRAHGATNRVQVITPLCQSGAADSRR